MRDTLERKRELLAEIKRSRALGPVTDKLVFDLQDEIEALEAPLADDQS